MRFQHNKSEHLDQFHQRLAIFFLRATFLKFQVKKFFIRKSPSFFCSYSQKQPPEVFNKNGCPDKIHEIHGKTPVTETLFY